MVDIIREAEEELEKEKLQQFWEKWGKAIIGGCVGIVLGTAGITGFKSYSMSQNEASTAQIMDIVRPDLGSALDTTALLDIVDGLPDNQATIARFIAIGDLIRADNLSQASAQLESVIAKRSIDSLMSDLARVQLAALYIEDVDKQRAEIEQVLKPIFGSPNSPWYAQAKLNMALAYAHKEENYEQAAAVLKQALDKPETPQSIAQQAAKLRDLYLIKSQEKE